MYQMHGTSLLSTPLPLWTSIITLGKKNDDEKTLLLKIIWLYMDTIFDSKTVIELLNNKNSKSIKLCMYEIESPFSMI